MQCFADALGVADRDCGLDHDGGLGLSGFGDIQDQTDHGLDGRAVEVVGLGVVIGRRGDDDEVGIFVCRFRIGGRGQFQSAFAGLRLGEVFLDVVILDRGDVIVELFDLVRDDIHGCNIVILCEQNGQRQAYIARSRDSDVV